MTILTVFKSSINTTNTRTFHGADIGSDHDLVLTTIKLNLKNKRIRLDLEKLKDPGVIQAQKGDKLAALNILNNDIDIISNNIKDVLLLSAEEVLGRERRNNRPWMTSKIIDLCDKRKELRHKNTSLDSRAKYQNANCQVRRVERGQGGM